MSARWKIYAALAIFVLSVLAVAVTFSEGSDSIYKKGRAACHRGDWAEVASQIQKLEKDPAFQAHASLLRGFHLKARNLPQRALLAFSEANNHPDTREESYFQGGLILFEQKQYLTCIPVFRQVVAWNPDHVEAHRLLAAACYDIGAMENAINSLESVMRLRPTDYRPHYLQATILQDFERFSDSAISFQKAAELAPAGTNVSDEIRAEWGDCLIRLRRFEEAVAAMEPAGPWPDVLARRAQAMFSLRRFDDAGTFAAEALSKQPLHIEATIVAAQVHERNGQINDGIRLLSASLEVAPNDLRLHQRLADLLAASGKTEEAIQHRTQAGAIASLRQQFSETLQKAVRDSESPELRLQLGELAEKLGETEHARNWYQAALGLSPGDSQIQERWSRFLADHPEFLPTATSTTPQTSSESPSGSPSPATSQEF